MERYSDSDITLRPLEITDADAAFLWYSDEKVGKFCSWDAFATRESAKDYFVKHDLPRPWNKVICVSGQPVGSISVNPFSGNDRCRAEMGYVVASGYWGRGIATRAVKMAAEAVFEEWDHLERLEAVVDSENTASQRVVEKAGFVRDGVFRKFYLLDGKPRDAVIFSLLSLDT